VEAALFVTLIKEVGVPLAEELLKLVSTNGQVTPETWDALKKKNATPGEVLIPPRPTKP